jgi:broad specificity phosphatase PhoE
MGEIILVRHGQANSSATDEEGYDRLSDLGRMQAKWLGEWFATHEDAFDVVLSGSLNRQVDTACAMGHTPQIDARLNEMDYYNLSRVLKNDHGIEQPETEQEFVAYMREVMEKWHRAEIQGNESFAAFEARVVEVLERAAEPGRRVLCVTSGGVIGIMLRAVLGLQIDQMAHMILPIMNTSVHRMIVRPHGTILTGFNAIPHLVGVDRAEARTYF